jgi:uncharacterized protein
MMLKVPSASIARINPDQWTAPYWKAAQSHRLVCACCKACGTFRLPPAPFCARCRTQEVYWQELSGNAEIYTFTIVFHAVLPTLKESVPYAVGVASLADAAGVRLIANVVEVDTEQLHIGMPVVVDWLDVDSEVTIPILRPRMLPDSHSKGTSSSGTEVNDDL